jgi:hypothetical protein
MKKSFLHWTPAAGWGESRAEPAIARAEGDTLVIYFGNRQVLAEPEVHAGLVERHPGAVVVGCSTGGQIIDDDVTDQGAVAVVLRFGATRLRAATLSVNACGDSFLCGATLGLALKAPDLAGVFVLSDGLLVNGSRLAAGLSSAVGAHVKISGGLAGDGPDFRETLVAANAPPASGAVVAVGFYGEAVQLGHGSAGGWDVFGPPRRITGARDNLLISVDGQPALDLYERYLGAEDAAALPSSALLFPLLITNPDAPQDCLVRTVLGVDRQARTMTFAGDMPEGWTAQLMRGHFTRLTDAALRAARAAWRDDEAATEGDSVALLVSCIGRRLLLGQRIDDEVEAAQQGLPAGVGIMGFYSYGELAPHAETGQCQLHNQTMTITTIRERAA